VAALDAELIAAVERSPSATDARDRCGWVEHYTCDTTLRDRPLTGSAMNRLTGALRIKK